MKLLKLAFILAFTALCIFACTQANNTANNSSNANLNARTNTNVAAKSNSPAATPADELASGKTVYMEKCVKCHKENGAGGEIEVLGKKRKAANLASGGAKNDPDEDVIDAIANGITDEGMPAFKDTLSDEQIKAVVKYIRQDLQGKK